MKRCIVMVVACLTALAGVAGAADDPEVLKDARVVVKEASGVALLEVPGRPYSMHATLTLEVRGDGVKGAIGIGPLELTEAVTDTGVNLRAKEVRFDSRPTARDGIVATNALAVLTDKEQGWPKKGGGPYSIRLTLSDMPSGVASLKGSVKTLWAARTEAVQVDKLEEKAGKALEDKRLDAAGVKVVVEKINVDGMMLELSGKLWAITGVRIKSGEKTMPMAMFERGAGDRAFIGVMGEMPENAMLELDVVTEVKEKVIPVELKDIEIDVKPPKLKKAEQAV
jgi:hypothetical protein